jgi:putative inorganic carbon (HCO3(-)) transporter
MLLFMLPVSLWASFDLRLSLPKAAGLLVGVTVFYGTVAYTRDGARLRFGLVAYVLAGMAVALVSLLGADWPAKYSLLGALVQRLPALIRGLPGAAAGVHPNEVAGVLLWFVPLQIALAGWFAQRRKLGTPLGRRLVVSLLCTTATLILTQSRSGWLGLAVGLAVMAAFVDRRVRLGLPVALAAALILVASRGVDWGILAMPSGALAGASDWRSRLPIWRCALWAIHDFPLTGMGLGAFRRLAPLLYGLDLPPGQDIGHAHNGVLQAGVDFGVPGMVSYVSIWMLSASLVVSALSCARGRLRVVAIGLAGCLAASFVYNLADAIALGALPMPLWWMMLGLLVSVARLTSAASWEEL